MKTQEHIGKYELEEFLGGGMSHVYRAHDTVLGRTVAVKILTDAACAQPEAKARFLAEARMASNLVHDNVLSIYDFGEDDQQRPFMVMEFLRGQDLRNAIQNGQSGDTAGKLRIALQVARAIGYIHSQKIIHRDIKPENILLNSAGIAKLMDFGIAKTEGLSMTRTGFVLGTPYYMAPEQVTGKEVTEQVDVYAFGVLLFELMTGVKPIAGETVERIFYIILNEPLNLSPLSLSGAPLAICELVARCTAKNPADRPQGFASICAALEEMVGVTGEHTAASAIPAQPGLEAARGRHPWRSSVLGSAAALVLLLGSGAALIRTGYHNLDAQVHSAAEGVSAAGIAADGLINPAALRQFEILRSQLDIIGGYHRQGAPPGYRLGALLWGDLYGVTRRLYFERFRTFFLGPAENNAVQFLRGLPATPGPTYSATYETLKAYLSVTSEPGKGDPKFLVPILMRWWGEGLAPGAEREKVARREFEFYARELSRDDPYSRDYDKDAVAKARQYLSQFSALERAYAFVMDDAASHNPAVCFTCQFPASEQTLQEPYNVPGQFTKASWDFVQEAVAHGDRYFAGAAWVVGDGAANGADWGSVAKDLAARYRADFVKAWRQYLQSGALAPFASVKDGAGKLADLSGEASPLTEWLSLAVRNTAVDDPSIHSQFQSLEAAAAADSRYRTALAALSAALQKADGGEAAAIFALNTVQLSQQAAKQIEASFHADPEGHLEVQMARMLDEPIGAARQVLR